MSKHEGKVAVITGGNSGIGLATAQRLANEGAYVFITGRRQSELDAAIKLIGKNVTAVQGDVSNLADLDRLYATVKQQKGRIDILFANAGGGEFAPLGSITEAHYDKTFNANVKGLLFTVQKALPLFTNGGSIILNASIVSIKGTPALSVYSATKAAVRSFARTWIQRSQRPQDSRQHGQPRPHRHPGPQWLGEKRRRNRPVQSRHGKCRSHGTYGHLRRNRQSRLFPGLRRRQLHHRHRTLRRRRNGPSLNPRPRWRPPSPSNGQTPAGTLFSVSSVPSV